MTNRTITTLSIRFAALLLFMKIFEQFGSYFMSVYFTAIIPIFEKQLHSSIDKFYYNGTFLILSNILISCILFFKAEWVSSKLIKEDSEINIGLTPEKLIKVILLTTGIIWLATSIYLIPDLYEYIQSIIEKVNDEEPTKNGDFSPIYYLLKTLIALLFVFRVEKISLYLEKKMNTKEV
jgi:formate hydrogenlyase subunit 3/multisubunit Na+/H+ antiporter MnhD subunit